MEAMGSRADAPFPFQNPRSATGLSLPMLDFYPVMSVGNERQSSFTSPRTFSKHPFPLGHLVSGQLPTSKENYFAAHVHPQCELWKESLGFSSAKVSCCVQKMF